MPFVADYASSVGKGLVHVGGHMESHKERKPIRLEYINTNTGDPEACKGGLRQLAITSSLNYVLADGVVCRS
jgi:hypothetical protein